MADNDTCRGVVADLRDTRMPRTTNPYRTTSCRSSAPSTFPTNGQLLIPAEMVKSTDPLGVDSSAIETARYETAGRLSNKGVRHPAG